MLRVVPSPRDRQLVRRTLGWDGQGGSFLKNAGEEFGITRERARQVFDRAVEQIRDLPLGETLEEALGLVRCLCNQSADRIQAELRRQGFTRYEFALPVLVKTALLFGRAPKFALEEAGGRLFAVTGPGVVRSVLRAVQQSSTRYGVQTVEDICAAIPQRRRTARDELLIRQILETRADLCWLDQDKQWFWLATLARNPVVRCAKKLLVHASPLTLASLHQAIHRLPRERKVPLPLDALARFCRQAPFCRVRGGTVEVAGQLPSKSLVSRAEAVVCEILRRHGNELPFERLRVLCASTGVSEPNLWRIVLHSPLVFRSAPRTYRLVTAAR